MRTATRKITLLSSTALLGSALLLASAMTLPSLSEAQAADCTYAEGDSAKPGCFYDGTVDSTIEPDASAPYNLTPSTLTNNRVTVTGTGTIVAGDAFGGYSEIGETVEGNELIIEAGAIVEENAFGGSSGTETAISNIVTVKGAGTRANGSVIGGEGGVGGSAKLNKVYIQEGASATFVYGGTASEANWAEENEVYITGAGTQVLETVTGGQIDSGGGSAAKNKVTISDGAQIGSKVTGGHAIGNGNAFGNTVTISGDTTVVSANVIGGWSYLGNTFSTVDGKKIGNSVIITGGTINGKVIGGIAEKENATHNTVTISGGNFEDSIYGGHGTTTASSLMKPKDVVTGNTLNILSKVTLATGKTAANFEHYNFHIGSDVAADDTMLTVDVAVDMAPNKYNPDNVKSKVAITSIAADTQLKDGDQITLINRTTNADKEIIEDVVTPTVGNPTTTSVESGISTIYEFLVALEDDSSITATMGASSTNDKAHAVTAGNNAGFVSSMDATLFAATDGLASFLAAAPAADGLVTFGAAGGRSTSYDNGQNIDLEGFN
ncbi:hypothetical protein, partial [Pseudovibrio flavus]|uniref:hypothetical protein n=1 Tax=Pseudovibrio flavus TaxID=2529854 RepID=UPI00211C9D26